MKKAILIILFLISMSNIYAQPANDQCANAITLTCGQTLSGQNTINAVLEDATTCLTLIGEDIWYKFDGNGDEVDFFLQMSSGEAYVEIYESTNNDCSGITLGTCVFGVGFLNGSIGTSVIETQVGTTYYIRVGNELNTGPTEFSIRTDCVACSAPVALDAVNTSTTSVDLSWLDPASADSWNIEWGATGYTQGSGNLISGVTTTTYDLGGLTSGEIYDFYVQADCGVDGTSAWSGPFTFEVTCLLTAPYTETFESFTVSSADFLGENCWTGTPGTINGYNWEVAAPTDTSSSDTGPAPSVTDGNYLFTEASAALGGEVTNLISPFVDLSPLANPELSFDYHMYGLNMGTLEILVTTGFTTTSIFSISGQQQTSEDEDFIKQTVDLSSYAGQSVQITFKATMGNDFRSDIAIDNVSFGEAILSVADVEDKNKLTYYPNPVENVLILNSLTNIETVEIYTMMGQQVQRNLYNAKDVTVDMSNLQSGVYFVKVKSENAFQTLRVLKK